jgi:hypothetical protein
MDKIDKDIFKSCFDSNVYMPENKEELITTVQRSEEVFIQLGIALRDCNL